jgi:imidazolonepropionase
MLIEEGKIRKIGANLDQYDAEYTLDTEHAMVTPGFIDPHTHIFPPNDRSNEFAMRVTKTYQEIAAAGGGILSSVKACRQSTFEELYERNKRSIERFIRLGTTTVEIKSGYGLTTESEIKQLQVINQLKEDYKDMIEIVPTFLGAHAFPPEYKENKDHYVDLICTEMIPDVARLGLAEYCDVFCENGYFSAS